MKLLLSHASPAGTVFIGVDKKGRFHPIWKGESLGSYARAQAAVEDVAGGHTFTPSDGTDMGELGLSDSADDWQPAATAM